MTYPLPNPSFYDASRVGELYMERGALVAAEALEHRRTHRIAPSSDDRFKIAAFGIDAQVGFCTPGASLFVPGAVDDTRRAVEWLYKHLGSITSLFFSLDTHSVHQIFHPAFWQDTSGQAPAPLTVITHSDVKAGIWRPSRAEDLDACLEYTHTLERSGRYVLTIWPYHTLLGGLSHALVPSLMEASIFHSVARGAHTHFETKGRHRLTENYSVLAPEVTHIQGDPVGSFNQTLFDALMSHDRVYVFGQASSHCVLSTLRDMQTHIEATDPSLADRVWILSDAMSPVPAPPLDPLPAALDFPKIAADALEGFAKAGFHVVKTTDPVEVPRG